MTIEKDISALDDSVFVIYDIIENCTHSNEEHSTIERNFSHLEYMLLKEEISKVLSKTKKTEINTAISTGKLHIANEE